MKRFWNWKVRKVVDQESQVEMVERTLFLNGTIAEDSWFDDDVTPQIFKEELMSGCGDVTVWINSPGGDCVAAAQIYNMLREYDGCVTVKVDGIAASAASVIAMAGDRVLISPTGLLMIHNPMTIAFGDSGEMKRAMEMLSSVKDSIINAYELKTGLSRTKLAHLMDAETWMDATKALELGFVDEVIQRKGAVDDVGIPQVSMLYSRMAVVNSLMDKIGEKCRIESENVGGSRIKTEEVGQSRERSEDVGKSRTKSEDVGRSRTKDEMKDGNRVEADSLLDRLFLIRSWR